MKFKPLMNNTLSDSLTITLLTGLRILGNYPETVLIKTHVSFLEKEVITQVNTVYAFQLELEQQIFFQEEKLALYPFLYENDKRRKNKMKNTELEGPPRQEREYFSLSAFDIADKLLQEHDTLIRAAKRTGWMKK